jgi:hypothetical protein
MLRRVDDRIRELRAKAVTTIDTSDFPGCVAVLQF